MDLKPGHKQTEVGVIPEDWKSTTVNSLAASVRNAIVGGPFGSDLVSRDYVDDGVPVIRGQNMGRRWLEGPYVFVAQKKAASLEANLARPGDVLFTQRGTLGQISLVPDTPYRRYLVSQSQMKVTLNRDIADPNYFRCWFVSKGGQESIRLNTIQTGVPHINLGILRSLELPLPPLPEQRAIAEALSDADALIESLEQLLTKKRHIKQAAMQELITGKKRLPGFSGKWEVKRLGDECELVTKGTTPTSLGKSFTQAGIHFIKVESLDSGGNILQDMIAFIDETTHLLLKRSQLKENDILVSIAGALGRAAIVDKNILPANTNQALAIVRLKRESSIHQKYVFFVLGFEAIKKHIEGISAQGAQANLSLQQVSDFPIFAPPLDEQAAIADTFSDIDAEITDLEAQLDKSRAIKQGMMQKLLTGEVRLI